MIFSDTSTKQGLLQDCEFWTNLGDGTITNDATLKATFTRLINIRYAQTLARLQMFSAKGGAEDSNYTDHQFSTFTITENQHDYTFTTDEDGNTISDITGVHIKMSDDTEYRPLARLTLSDADAQLIMSPPNTTETGTPTGYVEKGSTIYLNVIPDDSGTGKLFYRLVPSYFSTSDTTKKAGFDEAFHPILSIGASYDWLCVYKPENTTLINRCITELQRLHTDLEAYTRQKNPTKARATGAVHSTR